MSSDTTDRTDPISEVNSRLIPLQRVKQAKAVGIDVRLHQARRTFASLVATAADPPLMLRREFEIPGLGKIRTKRLGKFFIADEQGDQLSGFTVSFEYQGNEILKHVSESEPLHNALRKALYGHGVAFRRVAAATVYRLEVDPAIPAYIRIVGIPAGTTIAMTMSNIGMLGSTTYEIPAEMLDRKLVDALIDLVANGDRAFYSLVVKTGARRD